MSSIEELLYAAMKRTCWQLNWKESITYIEDWTRIAQYYRPSSHPATVFLYLADGAFVERLSSPCWVWFGNATYAGRRTKKPRYAQLAFGRYSEKKTYLIHRLVWEIFYGRIPSNMQIDHLCCRSLCINPDHLDLVSPEENLRRQSLHAKKTHCPNGHELLEENVATFHGYRQCRQCINAQKRRYYENNSQKVKDQRKRAYQRNREKISERRKRYYAENREKMLRKRREK